MVGRAGERMARLRDLSRPGAVVLSISLMAAAITGVALGGGPPRSVALQVGGRPPSVSAPSGDSASSTPAPAPASGPSGVVPQDAAPAAAVAEGAVPVGSPD